MKIIFFISFVLIASLTSCTTIKSPSKGKLTEDKSYYYAYFEYSGKVHNESGVKKCKVFLSHIRDKDRHIQEKIVYWNCSSLPPIKILYNRDNSGKELNRDYFIAMTNNDFTIPVSDEEIKLFQILAKEARENDYGYYSNIKGFRPATSKDSVEHLPHLKDVETMRKDI